jgi:hypothetical protein
MPERDIFIGEQTVTPAGELASIEVTHNWDVLYSGYRLDFRPEEALCLSAILSMPDRLTTARSRTAAIKQTHELALEKNMPTIEIIDSETGDLNRERRLSAEARLVQRKTPLSNYLIRIGHIGAKMILFCRNMSDVEVGVQIVGDYAEQEHPEFKTKFTNEFLREFRSREVAYERDPAKFEIDIPKIVPAVQAPDPRDVIKKTQKKTAKPVKPNQKKGLGKDIVKKQAQTTKPLKPKYDHDTSPVPKNELQPGFTDVSEYAGAMVEHIKEIGSEPFDIDDLEKWAKERGYNPNRGEIERIVLLAAAKASLVKRTRVQDTNKEVKYKWVLLELEY